MAGVPVSEVTSVLQEATPPPAGAFLETRGWGVMLAVTAVRGWVLPLTFRGEAGKAAVLRSGRARRAEQPPTSL